MATTSMYTASIPVFQHMLKNLVHILDKGAAHAETRKVDPSALTTFRLFPDMLPLTRQVLIACDAAKNGVARISAVEAPKFEDKEASFEDLKARIQKTLDYLATVPANALDGAEDKEITFPVGQGSRTMKGQAYLFTWVMPNFYFHTVTAYNILRHNGVELGKRDYLAGSQQ
jgi:hypothetical protein